MARPLTGTRFLAYARTQIADTDHELTQHGPHGGGCRCGRDLPCPEDKSLRDRRDHYLRKIREVRAAAEPHAPLLPASIPAEQRVVLADVTAAIGPPASAGSAPEPRWLAAAVRSAVRGERNPLSGGGVHG